MLCRQKEDVDEELSKMDAKMIKIAVMIIDEGETKRVAEQQINDYKEIFDRDKDKKY